MTSILESFPPELREVVFKHLTDYNDFEDYEYNLTECLIVCKSWNHLFQSLLYSDIVLYKYSQVPRLANTLEGNRDLRNLVTRITFKFYIGPNRREKILTYEKLFGSPIPNLEYIHFKNDWAYYSSILSKALIENQLPHLNYLVPPRNHKGKENYESCVNLFKDRLKNLTISEALEDDDYNFAEDENENRRKEKLSIHFQRLFDNLDQFQNISELHILKRTNNIVDLIEKVIKDLPSIEQLHVNTITNKRKDISHSNVDSAIISNLLPTTNVHYLKFSGGILLYKSQVLQYIMSKFTRLNTLIISGKNKRVDLDQHTFNQFLNYLTKIKTVKVDIIPHHEEQSFVDSVGAFWKRLSQSHKVSVECSSLYADIGSDDKGSINVDLEDGRCKVSIMDIARISSRYKTLFEKYGQYIDKLAFSGVNSEAQQKEVAYYESILIHPLKHCGNLKELTLSDSVLKASDFTSEESIERRTMGSLRLISCGITSDVVFEKLSKLFVGINHLEIDPIEPRRTIRDDNLKVVINMADINIGTLPLTVREVPSFDMDFDEYETLDERVFLVWLCLENGSLFCRYDFQYMDSGSLMLVSQEEYEHEAENSKCVLIRIKCKSLKRLEVNLYDDKASLVVDL